MICMSCGIIVYNKWIFHTLEFAFPITLTAWHLAFATVCTQLMARTTSVLDTRKDSPMTPSLYCRTILPISGLVVLSMVCGNAVYLYLTVSFIQMLKAATPVVVLLASWAFGLREVNYCALFNIIIIAFGVVIASFGETSFNLVGILLQVGGIVSEALKLVLVQKLLTPNKNKKMDALVLLYYYAPSCAAMIAGLAFVIEGPRLTLQHVFHVGWPVFLSNAILAFLMNVIVVVAIDKTSGLAVTLSGIVKMVLLIISSMVIFGDSISPVQIIGSVISIIALIIYQFDLTTNSLQKWRNRERTDIPVWYNEKEEKLPKRHQRQTNGLPQFND
ncbi:TPT-domain-containing protein [Myriangium duriaei CBS 260.36]|uniref:TPT-domain-containing protein n=1 Tax=Myriangium duriaei CBS 260.36 TaxID=1168546 RepID=A0A9P4IS18_9PEZI|nr:TPT-domain-containing protein [Myriangium duriaei CBS 260.36]